MSDKPTIDDLQKQLQNAETPKSQESKLKSSKAIIEDAVTRVQSGEVGAVWDSMVVDALKDIRATFENEYFAYRLQFEQGFKKHKVTGLQKLDKTTKPAPKPKGEGVESGRESKAESVINLLRQEAEFYHDEDNECWIRSKVPNKPDESGAVSGSHYEVHNLNSEGFRDYAELIFYRTTGGVIGESAMKDIIDGLRPVARHDSEQKEVCLRYAKVGDTVYINMANDTWQVIEVDKTGWRIKEGNEVPVLFTRDKYMRALPEPERGHDIGKLWEAIPIKDSEDRNRLMVWMITAMLPDTDYLMLEITGIAGASKSGAQKVIVGLIDPNEADLLTYSGKLDDIPVMAKHSHIVSYENMSSISHQMQDKFCSMLTGGANGTRTLHKTSERSLWSIKRPIVINGIPHLAVGRDDLTQRTIRLEMPAMDKWISKSIIKKRWEDDLRPKVLGALYDLLSGVLGELENSTIVESSVTRQVDLLREGQAVYGALGIDQSFEDSIRAMQQEQDIESIENCPVTKAIIDMMNEQGGYYKGTTTELLVFLSDPHKGYKPSYIDPKRWPKGYHALSSILRRQESLLKKMGIVFERTKSGSRRPLEFRYITPKTDDETVVNIEL